MNYIIAILAGVLTALVIYLIIYWTNIDRKAQRALNKYLNQSFSNAELGRFYERYIGHLYEVAGHDVVYHGALNGYEDLGRDLIVKCSDEVHIVQTKCWAENSWIREKHIFQLFGTTTHFEITTDKSHRRTKAVFYTTAKYSDVAKDVAKVLGVEIITEELNRTYPMIKCNVSGNGEKYYHLPFDPYYDKIKIESHKGDFFAKTIKDAVTKGFRRAGT